MKWRFIDWNTFHFFLFCWISSFWRYFDKKYFEFISIYSYINKIQSNSIRIVIIPKQQQQQKRPKSRFFSQVKSLLYWRWNNTKQHYSRNLKISLTDTQKVKKQKKYRLKYIILSKLNYFHMKNKPKFNCLDLLCIMLLCVYLGVPNEIYIDPNIALFLANFTFSIWFKSK